MKKIILAAVVGGLILWVWGFLAWAVLPLHNATMRAFPDEMAAMDQFRRELPGPGVYVFPMMPDPSSAADPAVTDAAMTEYTARYASGPTGWLFYDPAGKDPFMVNQLIAGFFIFAAAAGLVAWLLSRSTAAAGSFLSRVAFCGVIGLLIAVGTHLSAWNWMDHPFDWTRAMMIDSIVAWLLAGAGIAGIIRPGAESGKS